MSLQYPKTQEAVYLCNGAVSEKSPHIFRPPLPAEYMTVFSGRTDAPETTTVTLATHVWLRYGKKAKGELRRSLKVS